MDHNLTYDASANLMLAFRLLNDLSEVAKENGFTPGGLIDEQNGGQLYFNLSGTVGAVGGPCFLRGITTENNEDFAEKAESFRIAWVDFITNKKTSVDMRIKELKAELAELERRA